jgi:sugar lactone lactonase YvrE
MKNLVVIAGACLSAALLTGCGRGFSASTPASGANSSAARAPASSGSLAAIGGTNLYVANSGRRPGKTPPPGSVTVYGLDHGKLLQTITKGVDRPSTVAFDSVRDLIVVANQEPQLGSGGSGSVAVYSPGSDAPAKVLKGTDDPVSLAFDASGKIYVANDGPNYDAGIGVYNPNRAKPLRAIPGQYGMHFPRVLAFDPSGNLYVANGPTSFDSGVMYVVSVFAPGQSIAERVFEAGIHYPRALLVSEGQLYVANAPPKRAKHPFGWISVYPLGLIYPYQTITEGIHTPDALAVDGSGNLYVANLNGHSVTVYAPGGSVPIRTITDGATSPRALAIGPQGNLYVANVSQNSISVYKPGATSPSLKITEGLNTPIALTLNAP